MSGHLAGWEQARLADVAEIIQGQSPPGSSYNTEGRGLPFFQGKAEFGPLSPTPTKWCTAPSKTAVAGDVLISVRAPVGPTNLADRECCIGRGLAAIRPHGGMPSRFLRYFLQHTESTLQSQATGTTFKAISGDQLRRHQVVVPPLAEQHRIVAAIDSYFTCLDDATTTLERVKASLKRYRVSVLKAALEGRLVPTEAELARAEGRDYEPASALLERLSAERRRRWEESEMTRIVDSGNNQKGQNPRSRYTEPAQPDTSESPTLPEGWSWTTAEALSDATRSITYGVIKLGPAKSGGVPTLRSSDVRHLRLDLDHVKTISHTISEAFRRTVLLGDEVLVTVRGTLGGVSTVPEACRGFNISREVAMIALVDRRVARIVATFVAAPALQRWLMRHTRGITYRGINIEALKRLPIPLPPLDEQNRIAEAVERSLSVADTILEQAGRIERRFQRVRDGLLGWAFAGKLVAQDPCEEPASALLDRIRAAGDARPARTAGATS